MFEYRYKDHHHHMYMNHHYHYHQHHHHQYMFFNIASLWGRRVHQVAISENVIFALADTGIIYHPIIICII